MKEFFKKQKNHALEKTEAVSIFSLGGILGFFTIFCPMCTIGVVAIFGVSIGLEFFAEHNFAIKILSSAILLGGIFWMNAKLKSECESCQFSPRKMDKK